MTIARQDFWCGERLTSFFNLQHEAGRLIYPAAAHLVFDQMVSEKL